MNKPRMAIGGLLLCLALPAWRAFGATGVALAENQARFGKITGDVGLLSQGAGEWVEPHEGLPLEPGDHVRTGEDGEAEIALSRNAVWLMRPQAELVAERLETNAGRFSLFQGALLGKVDSTSDGALQHWEFNTPTAVCAVRGTEFAIEVSKEEGAHLAVFEGEVEMSAAEGVAGLPEPVRIAAGQEGMAGRGKPLQVLARFSPRMQAHLDRRDVLRSRHAALRGVWSPFTPGVRKELRARWVAPVPQKSPRRPSNLRRRQRSRPRRGG